MENMEIVENGIENESVAIPVPVPVEVAEDKEIQCNIPVHVGEGMDEDVFDFVEDYEDEDINNINAGERVSFSCRELWGTQYPSQLLQEISFEQIKIVHSKVHLSRTNALLQLQFYGFLRAINSLKEDDE